MSSAMAIKASLGDAEENISSALDRFQDMLGAITSEVEECDDIMDDQVRELDRIGCRESTHLELITDLQDTVGCKQRLCEQAEEEREVFLEELSSLRDYIDDVMERVYDFELPSGDVDIYVSQYID